MSKIIDLKSFGVVVVIPIELTVSPQLSLSSSSVSESVNPSFSFRERYIAIVEFIAIAFDYFLYESE